MNRLQEKFVFVPTDKASNNISVVCKQFYIKTMLNELKVFDDDDNMNTNTYEKVKEFSRVDVDEEITVKKQMTPELKIDEHIKKCKDWKIDVDNNQKHFPFMQWVPKLHKKSSK